MAEYNVIKSYRYGETTDADDPWGYGSSLEWATPTPPPRHNFKELPRIRSERPAFDLHYPHMVEQWEADKYTGPFAHANGRTRPAPSEVLAGVVNPDEISQGDPTKPN